MSLTRAMVIVAVVAVLLSFFFVPIGGRMEWVRLARRMGTSIRDLKPTQPNPLGPGTWDCAHGWVITAYWNICYSPEHTNTVEMYRLRNDLEEKLKGRIDLDLLKWIWDRLSKTGPHGKSYIERYEPSFRDCFPPGTGRSDLLTSRRIGPRTATASVLRFEGDSAVWVR